MEKQILDKAKELERRIIQLSKGKKSLERAIGNGIKTGIHMELWEKVSKFIHVNRYSANDTYEIKIAEEELEYLIKVRNEKIRQAENELEKL